MQKQREKMIEKFNLNDEDKEILIKAHRILADITDDLYTEDLEETEDYFKTETAKDGLRNFLDFMDIDYSD